MRVQIACASALLILMLLIIGMQSYMAPDAKEFKVFHILKYKRWKRAVGYRQLPDPKYVGIGFF